MKRFFIVLTILLIIPTTSFAGVDSNYENEISNFDTQSILDGVDDETKGFLKELGLDDFDYENIINITPKKFFSILKDLFMSKMKTPVLATTEVIAFVILSAFMQSLKTSIGERNLSSVFSLASATMIAMILVIKMSNVFSVSCSTISVCANFIYAFVPAFAVIVAASGGITTTFSTNALLLGLAQVLNTISSNVFLPAINCFLGLGIVSGIRPQLNVAAILDVMKRYITSAISCASAIFVAILSIKTAVAGRADALGLRSIRFAINSVVPVIGSAISEGILSIQSYSSLIKSSVGVVGIIAVVLIFLPAIIDVVIWRVCLSLASICSDIFGDHAVSSVILAFRSTLLLILVLLILSMVTTVISIGILIAVKAQGA